MTGTRIAVFVGAMGCAVSSLSVSSEVRAADHGDSPQVRIDTRSDINDVYLFSSPQTPANTVMVMTVCPLAGAVAPKQFSPKTKYEFAIDTDADAKEDQIYRVVFGNPDKTTGHQKFTVTGPNKLKVKATTEDTAVPVG